MKILCQLFTTLTVILFLTACSTKEPPNDSNGETHYQVLMETYVLILNEKYEEAKNNFSPEFIETIVTKNNATFVEYARKYTKKLEGGVVKNKTGWK